MYKFATTLAYNTFHFGMFEYDKDQVKCMMSDAKIYGINQEILIEKVYFVDDRPKRLASTTHERVHFLYQLNKKRVLNY